MNRRLYLLVLLLFTVSAIAIPPIFQRRLNAPKKPVVASTPVAGAWAPTDTGAVTVWYKADGATYAGYTNGQTVGTVTDESGNGRHATQATEGYKPTYVTSALNGKGGFLFVTNNINRVSTANISGRTLFSQYSGTITAIIATNTVLTAGASSYLCSWYEAYGLGENVSLQYDYYSGFTVYNAAGGGFFLGDGTSARTVPARYISAVLTNQDCRIYTNAVLAKTYATNINWSASSGPVHLGYYGSPNENVYFILCEVIIYNRNLTDAEIVSQNAYIKTRWNLGP